MADEVVRTQLRALGQLYGHPVLVLAQPDQFAAAPDLDADLGGMLGQQAVMVVCRRWVRHSAACPWVCVGH